jgi:hypothetical protein
MTKLSRLRKEKGEGMLGLILILAVVGGLGYAAYYYFLSDNSKGMSAAQSQGASAEATPAASNTNGQDPKAGSMAGSAVQGAQALGELSGGH